VTLLERVAAVLSEHGLRHALIGAAALAVHGVSRSTLDQDLLVHDRRVLDPDVWAGLSGTAFVDAHVASLPVRSRELWRTLRP
jgi:hypothetical protein